MEEKTVAAKNEEIEIGRHVCRRTGDYCGEIEVTLTVMQDPSTGETRLVSSLPLPERVFDDPLDFGVMLLCHGWGSLAIACRLKWLHWTTSDPFEWLVAEALERFLHRAGWSRAALDDID
jgi:hypothetical protein